jgi:predicted nuclease of predicted toxin-antitoxin system
MRFLIDEDLSRALVSLLNGRGHFAERVSDIGMSGEPDHAVWQHAFDMGAIFVTANADDFLDLAEGTEVHAGVIIFRAGDLTRAEQVAWMEAVLKWMERSPREWVNHVLEVHGTEEDDLDHYPLPTES